MKQVLCYGDSNTHGYIADTGKRYPFEIRWTGVLQKELGCKGRVIEEGLNGRTTIFDDPFCPDRNGATFLPLLLESHSPIDVLIIMLGTNDVLQNSAATVHDAACGVSSLIDLTEVTCVRLGLALPKVLLVAPPLVTDPLETNDPCGSVNALKTHDFSEHYRSIANVQKCAFLDASQLVLASKIDGIHLDADEHHKLGIEIARRVEDMT